MWTKGAAGDLDFVSVSLPRSHSPVTIGLLAVCGLLVLATLGLWAHYGTAVFFETIRAGIAACF